MRSRTVIGRAGEPLWPMVLDPFARRARTNLYSFHQGLRRLSQHCKATIVYRIRTRSKSVLYGAGDDVADALFVLDLVAEEVGVFVLGLGTQRLFVLGDDLVTFDLAGA